MLQSRKTVANELIALHDLPPQVNPPLPSRRRASRPFPWPFRGRAIPKNSESENLARHIRAPTYSFRLSPVRAVSSSESGSTNSSGSSRVNSLNRFSIFDSSTSSSSSAVLNKLIPSAVRTIAGLSAKETSFDFFFESELGGIRMVDFAGECDDAGVPESDLEWPLIPLGLMRIEGVRPGRSLGMSGSERSFRSVMFFNSLSALI